MGRAADLHSGGRGFKSSRWTLSPPENQYFLLTHFLKSSFDSTVTWHASKQDLSKIKRMSSGNSTMVIANGSCIEGTGIERRQRTAVVHSCQKPCRQKVVNQLSCGSLSKTFFFSFWTLFRAGFFFSDHNCFELLFWHIQHTVSRALIVCMTCNIGMQGGYSFFLSLCLNNHMAGTDQCYMHLMYLGNTSAQISKVHCHHGSPACCQLLSIELFHDRATLFFVRLMSPCNV